MNLKARKIIRTFLLLTLTLSVFFVSSYLRIAAAKTLLKRAGPSEYSLKLSFGLNPRCKSVVAVGFWQHGPKIPERQGYICGGVFTPAEMKVIPFSEGLVPGLDDT